MCLAYLPHIRKNLKLKLKDLALPGKNASVGNNFVQGFSQYY